MQVQFTYTAQDSVDAYKAHFRKRAPLFTRAFFFLAIPLGLFFVLILGLLPLMTKSVSASATLVPFAIGAWWIYFGTSYLKRAGQKAFRSRPERQYPYVLTLDETGVRLSNEISSSEYKWPCYVSFLETDNMMLLYVSNCAFEYFPKRMFSPEQMEEFRSMVKGHIGRSAAERASSVG